MAGPQGFDRERVQLNVAKLKKGGETFQIVVDPDLALDFKKGKEVAISEVLKSEQIFDDPKKGLRASETTLESIFGTKDPLKIAEVILTEGELQVTSEQREREMEEKRKKIVRLIHVNAIDPSNNLPHPEVRILNAFEEAKIKIDLNKTAEEQIEEIVKELRPIIPIKFAKAQIEISLSGGHAQKLYSVVKNYGKFVSENWLGDGSWKAIIEMPAGLKTEFMDTMNSKTHGEVTLKVIE